MKPRRVQAVAPREWRGWAEATPSALDSEWGRGVLDAEKMGDRADRSGQHGEHEISAAGDRSGARDRENPGRRNVPDHAPADGLQPVARAGAHDGAGDHVGRRDRHAETGTESRL